MNPVESADDTFDGAAEVSVIARLLLRHAAGLVTSPSQRRIVSGLCNALTESTPHLRLAWTWFGPGDARHIEPQIIAGPAAAYARGLVIDETSLTRDGPAFRALAGQPARPCRVSRSSPFEPWRRAAVAHGIRSALALPLRSATPGQSGIFVLYADLPDYFERVGVPLFEALAELFAALLSAANDRSALEAAAHSDALTGLGNRHMAVAAERAVYRSSATTEKASVLLLDLDRFKDINDRHGHTVGDQVLREVANHLRTLVRSKDRVLRWGGEEFLVCVAGTPMRQAMLAAEKIRAGIEALRFDPDPIRVTVSIGVAEIGIGMSLNTAIEAADSALYAAKQAGRNRVVAG
jgi:diguanylate cyclase (GGDEF)-like protein